ncbi:MAG: universal stress protein [Deltaproteobacteria bacterium]|nr:universal stress protein [Deltaproteobacteria bacterium]
MEKKILVAVDDSIHSKHAVRYAVRISSVVKELTYTLFHVQPTISQFLLDEAESDLRARQDLKIIVRNNTENAYHILEKHKNEMVRMGISEQAIETTTWPKILGLAKDVLVCAQQGLYDAIVVGRRGLSRTQKAFMGSTSANIVAHSEVVPVWVVDGDVISTKIMVAVDGSESAFAAVDHLVFLIGENRDITITLFHVVTTLGNYCGINFLEENDDSKEMLARGAKQCLERFYAHAKKRFEEVGLQDQQVEIKVTKRIRNVGKAIITEVQKGDYGTVVVGRRGVRGAFFMGSVSRYVTEKISNRAVWIVN